MEGNSQEQQSAGANVEAIVCQDIDATSHVEHPDPPYTEADDPSQGLACYYEGCKYKGTSYGKMLQHLRSKHGRQPKDLKGTFLHAQGSKDINQYQNARNKRKRDAALTQEHDGQAKHEHVPGEPESKHNRKHADAQPTCDTGAGMHTETHMEGSFTWKVFPCLVKCNMAGIPLTPLQYGGLAVNTSEQHNQTEQVLHGQALKENTPIVDMHSHESASVDAHPTPASLAQVPADCADMHSGDITMATPSAAKMSSQESQMLHDIHKYISDKQDTTKWLQALPHVNVKAIYSTIEPPKAKGEGVARAFWPKELASDCVHIPDFQTYLDKHMAKSNESAKSIMLGAGRALGALELTTKEGQAPLDITDLKVLVGLYTSNKHLELLDTPLLHPKYHWTAHVLSGLMNYAQFHLRELMRNAIQGLAGNIDEYKLALHTLIGDLKAGHSKRCALHKEEGIAQKARDDFQAMKHMPQVTQLQASVKEGYMTLHAIADKFEGQPFVPKLARGAANAAIAGGIHFDTFGGRKWEWEHADYEYVCSVLDAEEDFIVCKQHKTSRTYGDLAKKLTPGLFDAFACYRRLPRPAGCTTFLVPATQSAPCVHLPTSLKTFCMRHLPHDAMHPTTNLTRKWFHSKLMHITRNEQKLKEIMVTLDAHSKKVMDKHYILKGPEDDVVLANALIKAVLGKTVHFPTPSEVQAHMKANTAWAKLIERLLNETEDNDCEEACLNAECTDIAIEDEEEEPLQWWPMGSYFGIEDTNELHMLPLQDLDIELPDVNAPILGEQQEAQHEDNTCAKGGNHAYHKLQGQVLDTTHSDCTQSSNMDKPIANKSHIFAEYKRPPATGARRMKVDPMAHEWMVDQLKSWQQANNKGEAELPFANQWYLDKRIEAIKAGLLQKEHSEDIVRSYLKSKVKKQHAKAAGH